MRNNGHRLRIAMTKPEYNCLMCEKAPSASLLIDGLCISCRDLLLTHGDHIQGLDIATRHERGLLNRREARILIDRCLPQPDFITNHKQKPNAKESEMH